MIHQDTICAISTAQGGAIGCIRISGSQSIQATQSIFRAHKRDTLLSERPSHSLTYGHIYQGEELIDEVLVSLFRAPHSYTGEDSTEITCHGSPYILQTIVKLLISQGCRLAQPGEYTRRAFLNGKMDLSQAEAVADVIASSNEATHRLAMSQMRGGFSRELTELREKLLHFTALVELELDFSEEDVEFADRTALSILASEIETTIGRLVNSFSVGNAIKNGIPVAIIGETNAGKSTLLNTLLNEEKAIVSDIHGTTRDVIEDTINIQGITFRFIDTAGIRETTDTIEGLGIERTFQKLSQAHIVVWMVDATEAHQQLDRLQHIVHTHCRDKQLIIACNKIDLISPQREHELKQVIQSQMTTTSCLFLSAKKREGIRQLEESLVTIAQLPQIAQGDVIVTNLRHYEALTKALDSIQQVKQNLQAQLSGDFLSQDIREVIFHLSDIIGEVTNEMVLQDIFKNFCIGK